MISFKRKNIRIILISFSFGVIQQWEFGCSQKMSKWLTNDLNGLKSHQWCDQIEKKIVKKLESEWEVRRNSSWKIFLSFFSLKFFILASEAPQNFQTSHFWKRNVSSWKIGSDKRGKILLTKMAKKFKKNFFCSNQWNLFRKAKKKKKWRCILRVNKNLTQDFL